MQCWVLLGPCWVQQSVDAAVVVALLLLLQPPLLLLLTGRHFWRVKQQQLLRLPSLLPLRLQPQGKAPASSAAAQAELEQGWMAAVQLAAGAAAGLLEWTSPAQLWLSSWQHWVPWGLWRQCCCCFPAGLALLVLVLLLRLQACQRSLLQQL